MSRVILNFNDVVPIAEAAKQLNCNVNDILQRAAKSELLLYVALKPCSITLEAVPIHDAPRSAHRSTKRVTLAALQQHYVEALLLLGEATVECYQASLDGSWKDLMNNNFQIPVIGESPLAWHWWRLDKSQTIEIDRVYFPADALPVAKVPEKKSVWKARAQELARELYQTEMKQSGLATEIAEVMKDGGFKNDRGGELKAESIRKEVLTKEHLWDELKKK